MRRYTVLILSLLAVGALSGAGARLASQAEPNRRTHFYDIEYRRPVRGAESVAILNATFFVEVTGKQAESMLRSQLDYIIQTLAPKTDIMATAWYAKTDDPADEEQIALPDGSNCLFYSQKHGRVMLWKEYQSEQTKTPAGATTLDVTVEATLVPKGAGQAVVEGTTNLPDGMSLWVELRNEKTGYFDQAKAMVKGGRFVSEPLGENRASGKKLVPGKYRLEVSMPGPEQQPADVQRVIGKRGELLTGRLISVGNYGKSLAYTVEVQMR